MQLIVPQNDTFTPVIRKDGVQTGRAFYFAGVEATSFSAMRKALRDTGMSNNQAKEAVNAYLSGDHAKLARIKSKGIIDSFCEMGAVPTVAKQNNNGDKLTMVYELPKGDAAKTAQAALAKKAQEQADKIKELEAKLAAIESK